MATSLISLRAVTIQPCSASATRKPDPTRIKSVSLTSSTGASSSSNWWAPLFGWSSEPDYLSTTNNVGSESDTDARDGDQSGPKTRFAPGCFTKEKARILRMMTTDTSSFHEVMYHSSIASRLASDFKGRS